MAASQSEGPSCPALPSTTSRRGSTCHSVERFLSRPPPPGPGSAPALAAALMPIPGFPPRRPASWPISSYDAPKPECSSSVMWPRNASCRGRPASARTNSGSPSECQFMVTRCANRRVHQGWSNSSANDSDGRCPRRKPTCSTVWPPVNSPAPNLCALVRARLHATLALVSKAVNAPLMPWGKSEMQQFGTKVRPAGVGRLPNRPGSNSWGGNPVGGCRDSVRAVAGVAGGDS